MLQCYSIDHFMCAIAVSSVRGRRMRPNVVARRQRAFTRARGEAKLRNASVVVCPRFRETRATSFRRWADCKPLSMRCSA